MSDYKGVFDWVQFPEGKARFAGTKRCWDEQGHITFALELNGVEYFGEIDQVFLLDRHILMSKSFLLDTGAVKM